MRVLVTFTLILLCATKVQCDHESQACSKKESPPDVLSVPLGSELVLSCRGDVTLDGIPLVVTVKPKQGLQTRAATTGQWTSQKTSENPDTTGMYHSESRGTAAHQNVTTSGLQATKTTPKPATMRTPQAPNRPIQSNRVTRMVEEGGAMEMGMSSEISSEFGESEDYEENEEGLRVTRSIRRQARWTRNGQAIRGGVEKGGVLRLRSLQLVNSGNYSCFRASRLVSSVRILVSVAPERPSLSCYRKSHTSKIRCEWVSMQPIVPRPQCYLLLRKSLEKFSHMDCSYSPERSRCWCAFHYEEGDFKPFVAKLCVTNTAGSAMSLPLSYSPMEIIKPDPPTRVVVKPIQGQSHTLRVTWSYPATWKQRHFYVLHFQLRYRPVHATKYQEIYVESTELMWLISDALPHIQYEIQLQAKDEFDGQWSDWSSPVHGYTWTPLPEPTQISDLYTSLELSDALVQIWEEIPQDTIRHLIRSTTADVVSNTYKHVEDPFWRAYDEGSGDLPANPKVVVKADDVTGLKWVYVLWVVGLCLLIGIAVLFVCSIRVPLISKKCKQCSFPPCSCSTPVPPPLLVAPPHQQSQHYFLSGQEEEGEAVHLHNVDYFFSSYRLDTSES